MAGSANSIQTHNVLRGRLSEDNVIAGTVGTGYNPTYALVGEAAAQIVLYINSSNYKMYAELKDKNGNHIMNSNIIDLPLETMVVNGSYDSNTKEVVLILDNGNEIRFSVADLVRGLVSEEGLATILGDYIKFTDYATDSASGVLKTNFSNSFSVNPSNGVPYCDGKTYEQYGSAGNGMFVGKQTLENVITGKQLVNKTYVDEADGVFEEDLFGDASIIDSGENMILNNTIEKAPLSITLKGNISQNTTTGKNLWGEEEHGTIDESTGQDINNDNRWRTKNFISVDSNTQYTLSTEVSSNIFYIFYYYDENYTFISSNAIVRLTSATDTTPSNCKYMRCVIADTASIKTSNRQLEKGSTATSYEEFTGGIASPNPDYPQEIEVVTGLNEVKVEGKNLFDKDNANILNAYLDGTNNKIANNDVNRILYINCLSNTTYTITKISSATFSVAYTKETPANNVEIYGYTNVTSDIPNNYKKISITTGEGAKYLVVRFMQTAQDTLTLEQLLATIQIEQGSTATTYEAYQGASYQVNLGSIELCKISTYQDRIYKSNIDNNWYKHSEIGKIVLTGGSGESYNLSSNTNVIYYQDTINIGDSSNILSNYYFYSSFGNLYNAIVDYAISYNTSNNLLAFRNKNMSSTNDFKTWLSTHNTSVYYVLTTPTETQITDTTLVNQLNALEKATSYDTQTNISQVNTNLSFILDISTFKNTTKGKIEALEQEDENYEKLSNKVIELSSSSTDTEYPSAKCVYNLIGNIESILETLDIGNGV